MARLSRPAALTAALTLALGGGLVATSASASAPTGGVRAATTATTPVVPFKRTSTYPVHQNLPAGVDPAAETVAEISSVSPDGKTLAYTDAAGKRVGILDISNPAAPKGLGSIDLSAIENAEPTSVSIIGGYLVVVVDTSASYTDPSGRAIVYRLSDRTRVRTFQLGGQPDSIAVSKDGAYAAIAIENERDESATPAYGTKGGLPQYPAGRIAVLDLARSPWRWAKNDVRLTAYSGAALASLSEAGLDTPRDPEPEYVSINGRNQLAVTLQENNGVVLIDLATRKITKVFSVGNAKVTGIDTAKDGKFSFTGGIDLPREPDALAWIDDRYLATANEGDWKGGTRGWSIFDSTTGEVVWDAGSSFEHLAARHGLHNEDRAGKKGTEPEGVSVATIGGHRYAFVGSERSNFVAVYLLDNPTKPVFQQILATTNGPEGILPIPGRKMLAVSSEVDDADAGVRSSVNLFRMSSTANGFPSIVSKEDENGAPIGWGALGALTEDAGKPGHLYAASDSAYATGRIYDVDVTTKPATITGVTTVTEGGAPATGLDIEGIATRQDGGFWLASEGTTGAKNTLVRTNAAGEVEERVTLPADVAAQVGKWGLEGVDSTGSGADEVLTVVLQRPLFSDPKNATGETDGAGVVRIGQYSVANKAWRWFGYRLESTTTEGDWMGLSEVSHVAGGKFVVVERDKLNGPRATVKRIYSVQLPTTVPTAEDTASPLTVVDKTLAADLIWRLRADKGWTQEKLEGVAVQPDGTVYVVTDNDGVKDATGETVFNRLTTKFTG